MWRESEVCSGNQRNVNKRFVACHPFPRNDKHCSLSFFHSLFFFPPEKTWNFGAACAIFILFSLEYISWGHTLCYCDQYVWPFALYLHPLCSGHLYAQKKQCSPLLLQNPNKNSSSSPPLGVPFVLSLRLSRQKNRSAAKNKQEASLNRNYFLLSSLNSPFSFCL